MTANADAVEPGTMLHRELWSSWAGVLRSYAAAHSLGRPLHAVVEVSEGEILLRYGTAWLKFSADKYERDSGAHGDFYLTVNGQSVIDGTGDEMDLAAERLCREIIVA